MRFWIGTNGKKEAHFDFPRCIQRINNWKAIGHDLPADPIDCVFRPEKLINFSCLLWIAQRQFSHTNRELISFHDKNDEQQFVTTGGVSYFISSYKLCTLSQGSWTTVHLHTTNCTVVESSCYLTQEVDQLFLPLPPCVLRLATWYKTGWPSHSEPCY